MYLIWIHPSHMIKFYHLEYSATHLPLPPTVKKAYSKTGGKNQVQIFELRLTTYCFRM